MTEERVPRPYGKHQKGERILWSAVDTAPTLGYHPASDELYRTACEVTYVEPTGDVVMTASGRRFRVRYLCWGFPWEGPPPEEAP